MSRYLARVSGNWTVIFESAPVSITDAFTAANGTNLNGRTTTTGNKIWTVRGGSLDIQSNQARPSAGSGSSWATVDAGISDFDMSVVLTYHSDLDGLIFRASDASNYFRVAVDQTANEVYLVRNLAGVESNLGSWAAATSPGETATIRVVAVGQNIKIYVNATLRIEVNNSSHQTVTKHGIIGGASTSTRFDTFSLVEA